VKSGAPTSNTCGGAGTEEDRGGHDEDVCNRGGVSMSTRSDDGARKSHGVEVI
jgi:hypothetical protein